MGIKTEVVDTVGVLAVNGRGRAARHDTSHVPDRKEFRAIKSRGLMADSTAEESIAADIRSYTGGGVCGAAPNRDRTRTRISAGQANEVAGVVVGVFDGAARCVVEVGGAPIEIALSLGGFSGDVVPAYGDKVRVYYDAATGYRVPIAEVVGKKKVQASQRVLSDLDFFESL